MREKERLAGAVADAAAPAAVELGEVMEVRTVVARAAVLREE